MREVADPLRELPDGARRCESPDDRDVTGRVDSLPEPELEPFDTDPLDPDDPEDPDEPALEPAGRGTAVCAAVTPGIASPAATAIDSARRVDLVMMSLLRDCTAVLVSR